MNKDDIIIMAREAGLLRVGDGWTEPHRWGATELKRFAALVAAAEREECAKVCDEAFSGKIFTAQDAGIVGMATEHCAAAIRARGE